MIIATLDRGGAEAAFLRLAEFLRTHVDVTIAVMGNKDRGLNSGTSTKIAKDIPILALDDRSMPRRSIVEKILRWIYMLHRTRRLKSENDVCISFLSGANILNALAPPRRKTIVSQRGSSRRPVGMSAVEKSIWNHLLNPMIFFRARFIVAASYGLANEIKHHHPVADLAHDGKVLTREKILDAVWGREEFPTTRTIDMHVLKLRRKLEEDPERPRHLVTVHGVGYRFDRSGEGPR